MYKIRNKDTQYETVYIEHENGSITSFPFDPDNTDYQAYLRWLEEGNTVLPAEENQ